MGRALSYVQRFRMPEFKNQKGERMPDNTGWQSRHLAALKAAKTLAKSPAFREEASIVSLIEAWAFYADNHRTRYASSIGSDGVLGPAWAEMGKSLRTLLNGECGRLDCGTLDAFICTTLTEQGFGEGL